MTGSGIVRTDPAHWQRWWQENQNKVDADFERDLLDARGARLVRLQSRFDRFVGEARAILEELYQTAPEKNKESILLRYLRSPEPETRALGAKIVQDDFQQARAIPAAVRDQLRAMVADSSSQVRIVVAQALFRLNDPQAFDALLAQLAREQDADVRMELARALVPMRDVRVVEPLLKLLRDPSLAVAEVAARGLADENLTPLIQKDANLAARVSAELSRALARTGAAGTTSLRVAIVDAMAALKNPNLARVYTNLLNGREPVPVRRAALRALGALGKPNGETWPATAILDSLADPDDAVRQEAVRALKHTADFSHAQTLYELWRRDPRETSPALRDEAWGVLRNLFSDPSATNNQLMVFADRFRGDPERRIEVLKVLAQRLTRQNDEKSQPDLANVRLNLGAEYMELARRAASRTDLEPAAREQAVVENAKQADNYFDLSLQHYRAKDPTDEQMTTTDLLERRMDALLTSRQYTNAAEFAARSIAANSGNQESMGRKIYVEADRLLAAANHEAAQRLIEEAKKMSPPLQGPAASSLERIEAKIRQTRNPPPAPAENGTTPRSAVGSGQ
jgi:HEAT repeat protein